MPKVSLLLSSGFEPTSIRSMHKPNPVHIKTSSETLVPEEPSRKLTRRENLQNFHHRPHSKPAVFAQIRLFSSSHVHIQFHVCAQERPHNFCQARTQNFVFFCKKTVFWHFKDDYAALKWALARGIWVVLVSREIWTLGCFECREAIKMVTVSVLGGFFSGGFLWSYWGEERVNSSFSFGRKGLEGL